MAPTSSTSSILRGFEKKATRYFVYRNINKSRDQHVYSLKNKKTGRVEQHVSDTRYLADPVFKVSDKGRARVLREGRKNVHAGIEASLDTPVGADDMDWRPITYDPKRYKSFIFRDTKKPIRTGDAEAVRIGPTGVYAGKQSWEKVAMDRFWAGFEKQANVVNRAVRGAQSAARNAGKTIQKKAPLINKNQLTYSAGRAARTATKGAVLGGGFALGHRALSGGGDSK